MTIGTEHEYSINDRAFNPLPVSDRILKAVCGRTESEIVFGDVKLGKELQKTVLEIVPRTPAEDLAALEAQLVRGISRFYRIFDGKYRLLGLGMHPTLTLDQTAVWDHDEREYYDAYDRLFNLRQHGWLNIQALQINLSFGSEYDLVQMYNRTRMLLPYLIAVTAASPIVEGQSTGIADNRLVYYRKNQEAIPLICNRIVPEKIRRVRDYRMTQAEVYRQLRERGGGILCREWVNSSGLIIRFSRSCLEIKALDEQEAICSDMGVCAFLRSLLRCPALPLESDQAALLELTEDAIRNGCGQLRPELLRLYAIAWDHATADERRYLPFVERRIHAGSLAEQVRTQFQKEHGIVPILESLSGCLRENIPYSFP